MSSKGIERSFQTWEWKLARIAKGVDSRQVDPLLVNQKIHAEIFAIPPTELRERDMHQAVANCRSRGETVYHKRHEDYDTIIKQKIDNQTISFN